MEPEDEVSREIILRVLNVESLSAKLGAVFETDNTEDKRKAFESFEDANLFIENNELLSTSPENESSFPHSIASLKEILVEPLANCLLPADREEILALFRASEERDDVDAYLNLAKEFQKNMKIAVESNRTAYNAQTNPQTPAPQTLPPTARPMAQFTQQGTPPTQRQQPNQAGAPSGYSTLPPREPTQNPASSGYSTLPPRQSTQNPANPTGSNPNTRPLRQPTPSPTLQRPIVVNPPPQPQQSDPTRQYVPIDSAGNAQRQQEEAAAHYVAMPTQPPVQSTVSGQPQAGQPGPGPRPQPPAQPTTILNRNSLFLALQNAYNNGGHQQDVLKLLKSPLLSQNLDTATTTQQLDSFVRQVANGFIDPEKTLILNSFKDKNTGQDKELKVYQYLAKELQAELREAAEGFSNNLKPQSTVPTPPTAQFLAENMLYLDKVWRDLGAQGIQGSPWMLSYEALRQNKIFGGKNPQESDIKAYVNSVAACFYENEHNQIQTAFANCKNPQAQLSFARQLQQNIASANQAVDSHAIPTQQAQQLANLRSKLHAQTQTFGNTAPTILSSPYSPAPSAALRLSATVPARASATAHANTNVSDKNWRKIKQEVKAEAVKFGKTVAEPTPDKISIITPKDLRTGVANQGIVDITRHASGLDVSTTESPPHQKTLHALVENYKIAASVLGVKECEISSAENALATSRLIIELDKGPNSIKPIVSETLLQDLKRAAATTTDPIPNNYSEAVKIYEKWHPTAPRPSASPSPI